MTHPARSFRTTTLAVVLLTFLSGCASDGPAGSAPDSPGLASRHGSAHADEADRFRSLSKLARAESDRPDSSARSLPVPPGIEARLVEPLQTSDPSSPAREPLDAALARLGRGDLVEPEATPPKEADAGAHAAALRLYASGRAKLLAGDVGGALVDLESASRLDPASPEVWRELGEAQMMAGRRLSAVTSLRQAVRRGLREPKTLWQLGRQAQRSGRSEEAVRLLGAALDAEPASADPTLPYLISADLADSLTALGYQAAAAEALDAALGFPEPFTSGTRLRLEFAELLRRRGDMARDLGDLYCRLSRYDRAADAYAQASLAPSLDEGATLPRLVYVSLRMGRPSEAALTLLEQVEASQGFPDARSIALVRFLSERTGAGPALAAGFDEIRAQRGATITPSVAGALTRAKAAALGADRGRAVLLEHLARHPDDAQALAEVVGEPNVSAVDLASRLVLLVEQSPAALPRCADAALARGGSADALMEQLSRRDSDAAVALRAMILAKQGFRSEAADLVVGRRWGRSFEAPGLATEVILASARGRYAEARAAFDRLRATPGTDPRLMSSAALSLQRGDEALALLGAALSSTSAPDSERIDMLTTAAGLCAATGKAGDAEHYLERAVAADPNDERAYAGLFRLYQPGGALADQNKLADVIRGLRDSAPSARVLRMAAAQELAERRLDAQAAQLLLGLVEDDLSDSGAGGLLAALWERRATPGTPPSEDAELAAADTWLRTRAGAYPEVHWLWVSLARIMAARGDAAGAELLLAERYAARPSDDLARAREAVVRDNLGRGAEADAAALARVRPLPRTIGSSVELVDLLVRTDKRDEALIELRENVPRDITLTDDQQAMLGVMLARVASKYMDKPLLTDATSSALIEEIATRGVRLPPQLHLFRIAVLASRIEDDPAAVRAAAGHGAAQHPALAAEMYKAAAAAYLGSTKLKRALVFLRLYAENDPARNAELVFQLVRAVVLEGDDLDLEWLLANIKERAEIEGILRRLSGGPNPRIPDDDTKLRAEFAYRIAGELSVRDRKDLAHAAYRSALGFDPDHAWTMNDWGYQLLEGGGDFAQAASLIEGAYSRLPNEPSIIDSLAWVRYNQGVLRDDPGPPVREGAITLFRKAIGFSTGAKNATIFDHLGDALWAAGDHEEATEAWKKAEEISAADLQELRRTPGAPSDFVARLTGELDATRAKLRAVRAGETPSIAGRRGA